MEQRLWEAPCGFISMNHDGCMTEVNQTFLDWLGYDQRDVIGSRFESLLTTGNKLIFHSYFFPAIQLDGHVEELFINFRDRSGASIPFLLNARRFIRDGLEAIECILVQMRKRMDYELELRGAKRQMEEAYREKNQALAKLEQIHREIERKQTELTEMNADLLVLSYTDKLTGMKNRRFFQEKLEERIGVYSQEGKGFSLLLADIDHFKQVNDTYGHQTGDAVLVQLAELFKARLRAQDIAARFGGEEFAVILPDTDEMEAKKIAQRLNQAVEQANWKETGGLTISIGIATFSGGDTGESVILHADQALYASKENGRNRSTPYSELNIGE